MRAGRGKNYSSASSTIKIIAGTWKRRISEHKKLVLAIIILLIGIILFACLRRPEPVDRISSEGYTHNERFNNSIVVDGIDVSEHQGEIDWDKVKRAGVDYAFVRVGYRGADSGKLSYDSNYEYNLKQAHKHGLMVGAYIYSQAITVKEAIKEAEFLLEGVKRYDIDLPLIIDYEFYPDGRLENEIDDMSYKRRNSIIRAFCRTVNKEGYDCGLYANYNMLVNYLDGESLGSNIKIWTAQYNDFAQYKGRYQYWQCSDNQSVAGIEGGVDKDFWYLDKLGEDVSSLFNERTLSVTECVAEFKKDSCKFKGWPLEPRIKVSYMGKTLIKHRDYEISYIKNTAPGTGYAVIRGVHEYSGIKAFPFEITE